MKISKLNSNQKQLILERLIPLSRSAYVNADTARSLESIRLELNNQPNTDSPEVFEIGTKIFKYVNELGNDITEKSYRVADIRINKITQLLAILRTKCSGTESSQLMPKNELKERKKTLNKMLKDLKKKKQDIDSIPVPISNLYSDEEFYIVLVAQLQDQFDILSSEIAELSEKLYAAPSDKFIETKLKGKQIKLSSIQQNLQIMSDESNRANYVEAMKSVTEADKIAIANRTVSAEQLKNVQAEYNNVIRRRSEEKESYVDDISNFIDNGNVVMAGGTAQAVTPAQQFSKLYSDIGPTVKALTRNVETFSNKISELDEKLKSVDRALYSALEKRKNLAPSQRLTFDGEIDNLNSERNSIVTAIKKYRQAQAVNRDKLTIATDLQNQMEIKKVEAEAGRLAGSIIQDWESAAMELKQYTSDKNEELERMADVNAVATSEEIQMNSATGTRWSDTMVIENDDDKYEVLERELGMRN